uniref:Uncharacterized protein n=1 Tax=Rhizophora mucronata TaxID=61149 RepID=A0A2P2LXL7_RHIMU
MWRSGRSDARCC